MNAKQIAGYTVYTSQKDILGRGSFGVVYMGIKDDTHEKLAVKIIPKHIIEQKPYLCASLNNEINILRGINSDNVVRFLQLKETANNYYIIQELCEGDLCKVMRASGTMKQAQAIDILTQLCNGFFELVRQNITHRDLKPANILVSKGKYKLADFGFSKKLAAASNEHMMKMASRVGTPLYMAPQILMSQPYTNKCDIWALGFIFYEMLHNRPPWIADGEPKLVENIKNQPLLICRKDLSPETVDFIERTLRVDQSERLSWKDVFTHPIFKGIFAERMEMEEYEETMMGIMTKLRQYFNLNKYSLEEFLDKYGFKDRQEGLSFPRYFDFLRAVYPEISEEEAVYIFNITDIDSSGTISVEQIIEMLKIYGFEQPMEEEMRAAQAAWQRMTQVFIKLHKVIERNKLSLQKVFNDFSKQNKGNMNFMEFKTMVQKMCKEITDQEARLAFKVIDEDNSDTLEFEQLKKHYQNINQLQ